MFTVYELATDRNGNPVPVAVLNRSEWGHTADGDGTEEEWQERYYDGEENLLPGQAISRNRGYFRLD